MWGIVRGSQLHCPHLARRSGLLMCSKRKLCIDVDVGVDDAQVGNAACRRLPPAATVACCRCRCFLPQRSSLLPLQGLMLVLAHPDAHIVGISAVHGNVDVARVGRNIARVLTLCGRTELPFYLGADEPLVPPAAAVDDASFVSGRSVCGKGEQPGVRSGHHHHQHCHSCQVAMRACVPPARRTLTSALAGAPAAVPRQGWAGGRA